MHMDLNKIQLIGRLAADPTSGVTTRKTAQVYFRLAVNRGKDRVDWFTVRGYGRLAEVLAKYLRKGDRLYVEGQVEAALRPGAKSVAIEVVARNAIMLGGAAKKSNDEVVVEEIETDNGAGV